MQAGDVDKTLHLSAQEWDLRKSLWPDIETDVTRRLDVAGREAGASFSRICGAGGGGVMVFFCDPEKRDEVSNALSSAGGEVMPAQLGVPGLTVEVQAP